MSFFSNIKNENIFVQFIRLLGVKYTKEFADKLYEEHPYKYSLYGLSKMLDNYHIRSLGVKADNKSKLTLLEVPFIAHTASGFALVHKMDKNKVSYFMHKKEIQNTSEEFLHIWSGMALLAESTTNSIEPDYKKNRQQELVNQSQKLFLLLAIFVLFFLGFFKNELFRHVGLILSFFINAIGVYIGYLLILKQFHIQSEQADKICSLFKKSDCNNVLESPAAKFMGVVGWSEIGLGYFISNLLLVVFSPDCMFWLALINIGTLPYTFWSIWYQKYRVREWCILCLIVQLLLWAIFVLNVYMGYISFSPVRFEDILLVGCIYLIPFLMISLLQKQFINENHFRKAIQRLKSFKLKEEVFSALLHKESSVEVSSSDSQIIWGNKDASMNITILSNPHCNPCARMHLKVEDLLKKTNERVCVRYIFSSFNKKLEGSSKYLIGVYLDKEIPYQRKKEIYSEWFDYGKFNKEKFFEMNPVAVSEELINAEYRKHIKWKERAKIYSTPTVFVNGFKLPEDYNLEDLCYFENMGSHL